MAKNQIKYYKELLKIGNPDAKVGILTLWTICDKIAKDVDSALYYVAGQLYTKGGINYVVRNLLANKTIRYIVVCGQDRSGSGAEIVRLWQTGKSEFLQKEIKEESVQTLIKNVQLINLIGEEKGTVIAEKIKTLDLTLPSYGEPEEFAEPQNKELSELECSWPTDESVFKVRGKTVAETWLKILQTVLKFGDVKETDAMKMKEVLNLSAVVIEEDPDNFFLPDYLGFKKDKVEEYLPQVVTGEKNPGLHYTYGNRLQGHFRVNQVEKIIEKLKADPNAREAVGLFFDPNIDHDAEHRPCLTLIQALRNKGKLNLNVYVRSHDLFGGWPLNAFGLRKLQQIICQKTNLPLGVLTIISASAHIYDFNWDQALKTVRNNLKNSFEQDPRGFFKIDIDREKKEIIAQHYNPEGLPLKKYTVKGTKPKAALDLANQLDRELGISLISHALDLGIELQKAEVALKLGIEYIQDKPLEFNF